MGLKQSKRSFQVTTDTPKKDGAPEVAVEAIEVKEAPKDTAEVANGDAAAKITKTEVSGALARAVLLLICLFIQ